MIGEGIGNYRVTAQIGSGGMGVVYEARHELLGKRAAVKVLLPERSANKEMVERFFNEAKASSLVHHPGIVEIYDFGHLPTGNAYIIMELLEGETLAQRLQKVRPMSPSAAIAIARHIAGILAETHRHGIIHRDLKPDNVFLIADPALPRGERCKLLDFGIAKLGADELPSTVKTETGRLMGTPYYMSPEQCRGSGRVDHRSDIYALGCVLYQLVTGRPPFVLEGSGEVLAAHIHVPPLPPRSIEPTVPMGVEKIIMRLLEKDPDKRFQTMDEVIGVLNGVSLTRTGVSTDSEPSLAASTTKIPTAHSMPELMLESATTTLGSSASESRSQLGIGPSRRNWVVPLVVAGGLAGLVIAAIIGLSSADDEPKPAAPTDVVATQPEPEPPSGPTVTPMSATEAAVPAAGHTQVTLVIESKPDGAVVYRESDGVRLGKTPLRYQVTKVDGDAVFILKKRGFRDRTLTMRADKDDEFLVEMEKRDRRGDRQARTSDGRKAASRTEPRGAASSKGEAVADKHTDDRVGDVEPPGLPGATKPAASKTKPPPDKDGAIDPFNLVPKKK